MRESFDPSRHIGTCERCGHFIEAGNPNHDEKGRFSSGGNMGGKGASGDSAKNSWDFLDAHTAAQHEDHIAQHVNEMRQIRATKYGSSVDSAMRDPQYQHHNHLLAAHQMALVLKEPTTPMSDRQSLHDLIDQKLGRARAVLKSGK